MTETDRVCIRPRQFSAGVHAEGMTLRLDQSATPDGAAVGVDVVLSWRHTKALVMYLYGTILAHEEMHGVVAMPEGAPPTMPGASPAVAVRVEQLRRDLNHQPEAAPSTLLH
jgi:hypothetical protein